MYINYDHRTSWTVKEKHKIRIGAINLLEYRKTKRYLLYARWPIEDMPQFFYRAIELKYRAINGKLVWWYVTGCHACCFRGWDDNGCSSWKFYLSLEILQTCNNYVIRKIRQSTLVLRHWQPSPKVSRKISQNQGLQHWFTELFVVKVLQSITQWSFHENKTNYWPQNIPPQLLQPLLFTEITWVTSDHVGPTKFPIYRTINFIIARYFDFIARLISLIAR